MSRRTVRTALGVAILACCALTALGIFNGTGWTFRLSLPTFAAVIAIPCFILLWLSDRPEKR